jgi:hypothetical protein
MTPNLEITCRYVRGLRWIVEDCVPWADRRQEAYEAIDYLARQAGVDLERLNAETFPKDEASSR